MTQHAKINDHYIPEITTQSGAPGTTPPHVGFLNVDTTARTPYIAVGTGSSADWLRADCPTLVKKTATGVAEGNNSLTGFVNKCRIESIKIATTSARWHLTIYEKDDYSTSPCIVVGTSLGNLSATLYLPIVYQDQDGTSELHYNFTDEDGTATHDIEVRGWELK